MYHHEYCYVYTIGYRSSSLGGHGPWPPNEDGWILRLNISSLINFSASRSFFTTEKIKLTEHLLLLV